MTISALELKKKEFKTQKKRNSLNQLRCGLVGFFILGKNLIYLFSKLSPHILFEKIVTEFWGKYICSKNLKLQPNGD